MDNLLTQYSLTEILVFLFVLITALKTTLTSVEWLWERISRIFKKQQQDVEHQEDFTKYVQESEKQIKEKSGNNLNR